jgi:predicted nucleic acid-binding protein
MKPSVYLETSVIGYLTSRPSKDLITAANQQVTRQWWEQHRGGFDLFISQFVIDECVAGDPESARQRLNILHGIEQLDATLDVETLAGLLQQRIPLPAKAGVDALHIAVASVHGIEYLLTWNCAHIANAMLRPRIEMVCRSFGNEPPTICTPQELDNVD